MAAEKRGGFTKSEWKDLMDRLRDINDPAGEYRSPNPTYIRIPKAKKKVDELKIASAKKKKKKKA